MDDADLQRDGHQSRAIGGIGNARSKDFQKSTLTGLCTRVHAEREFNVNLVRLGLIAFNEAVVHPFLFGGVFVHSEDGLAILVHHERAVANVPDTVAFGHGEFTLNGKAESGHGPRGDAFEATEREHRLVGAVARVPDPHADGLLAVRGKNHRC